MNANEIFRTVDPETVSEILDWFRNHDRNVYKTTVATLAADRKVRPVFVQKKSLKEQYAWILKTLQLRTSEAMGVQLLQTYLMSAQQSMLGMFCDGLGIAHDGKGSVTEELPKELDKERLDETVERLVDVFDPKIFTLYLYCFNMQMAGGYPLLTDKLAADDRLTIQ